MTIRLVTLFVCVSFLISCKQKTENNSSPICYTPSESHPSEILLPDGKMKVINDLFSQNNLEKENLQFYDLSVSEQTNYTYVKCHQYINDIKVLTGDVVYVFDTAGVFNEMQGDAVSVINLDDVFTMSRKDLVEIFRDSIKADGQLGAAKNEILADCPNIDFGYYDKNAAGGSTDSEYIKAWELSYDNFGAKMIVDEVKGQAYFYNNGVR